jgi:hypothetical protein
MEGDANGAPHLERSAYANKFSGKYEHRTITGGIGHNLPQEAPKPLPRLSSTSISFEKPIDCGALGLRSPICEPFDAAAMPSRPNFGSSKAGSRQQLPRQSSAGPCDEKSADSVM